MPEHHHHGASQQSFGAAFLIGITLNSVFVVAEIAIGLRVDSLALVADGVHNFADVISLVLAGVGYWFQSRKLLSCLSSIVWIASRISLVSAGDKGPSRARW